MTAVAEHDPYLLPLPGPGTPVIRDDLIVGASNRGNARYGDLRWPLDLLSGNPSGRRTSIVWNKCPAVFEAELRLAAWNLINGQLRPSFIKQKKKRAMRQRVSVSHLYVTVLTWMDLASWLAAQGVSTLATCGPDMLDAYAWHLAESGASRGKIEKATAALTRLWAFDQLSARPCGIGRPRWEDVGIDDYLPPAAPGGGENSTEPLDEATMGPLLVWAMRVVDDFADDILAAWAEYRRLMDAGASTPATPQGLQAVRDFLVPLIEAGLPLPAIARTGTMRVARHYIADSVGAQARQVDQVLETLLQKRQRGKSMRRPKRGPFTLNLSGSCPLSAPIKGTISDRSWRQAIDFDEAATLLRHLGTAAFIVVSYLTGMRPGEVLGLRTGCCPDPDPDVGSGHHLIRGNEYKTALDEDGNHLSTGVERGVPWIAITPVVNTIRVLERMVPDGALLFDAAAHNLSEQRSPAAGAITNTTLRDRIEVFVAWANECAAAHGLDHEGIPPDRHGAIGTMRFRRTLAWHIARRPGGLIALAVQYGHMRTAISGSYASRGRGGIHDLLDLETVRAVADTVADLGENLETGGGVSGPAARHAIKTAVSGPSFAGAVINATTARRLAANEDVMLYENPNAFLLCRFRREQALCQRDGIGDVPRLDRCRPECGNVVRTDRHASQLRERADFLEFRGAHAPGPVGDRLRGNAPKLRASAEHHDRTRITLQEPTV